MAWTPPAARKAAPPVLATAALDKATGMNKTETAYGERLELQRRADQILHWRFEPLHLKLGPNLFYRPDFLVVLPGGRLQFHETKGGFIREDAEVKFKAACELFPYFHFLMVQLKAKTWTVIRDSHPDQP